MINEVTTSKFGYPHRSGEASFPSQTRTVSKPEKIALCRECHGTGLIPKQVLEVSCPLCAGSGRVLVSCELTLHIRPYKERVINPENS